MPGAGEVQCVGGPQAELRPRPGRLDVHLPWHVERFQLPEQRLVCLSQERVTSPQRPDQTFQLDQGRDREPGGAGIREGVGDAFRPDGMTLDQVNEQAGIEINQSQDDRSCSISASISAPDRCA